MNHTVEKPKEPGLTREFTGKQVVKGIRLGIVSKDVLEGKPVTFDERMQLEQAIVSGKIKA